jgi:membrane protease YdiL (CAAX protease family)
MRITPQIKQNYDHILGFIRNNWQEMAILISATVLFIFNHYHIVLNEWLSSLLYFAFLPVLVIVLVLRRNPLNFGLRWGNAKFWGPQVIVTCLVLAPILYFSSLLPDFQKYYHQEDFHFWTYFLTQFVLLMGWEYIFRGFLLFGLKDKFKETAIVIQMVPFVLLHIGKPELETISTIFTGLYFGWVCYRGQSYWPALLIHLFINIFFVTLINLR